MKNFLPFLCAFILAGMLWSCSTESAVHLPLYSPDKEIVLYVHMTEQGQPAYSVEFKGIMVIDTSFLSFEFQKEAPMKEGFEIVKRMSSAFNDTWEMPWGEQREVVDNYMEHRLFLQEKDGKKRKVNLIFRAYDDGVAFRYEFPSQAGIDTLIFMDENSEFALTGDHDVWWIPGDWDSYEHLYNQTKFSEIDTVGKTKHPYLIGTHVPEVAANTPVTMKTSEGVYLSFHEASLTNYPGITLKKTDGSLTLTSELVGSDRLGYKAKVALPFATPWRTIQIADRAGDLIESKLIVNLNEPNKLGDISSYFKPIKYMGIWWHIQLKKYNF